MSTALRTYIRGNNLVSMIDHQANQKRVYHFDHQGTTQCLTDGNGNVTDRFAADAWGVPVKRTGTSINRHWYVGNWGYHSGASPAVAYVRQRHYAPRQAGFKSADPVLTPRVYQYVQNQPVAAIDPSGLIPKKGEIGGPTFTPGRDYVYTCRCGWIDATHMETFARAARRLYLHLHYAPRFEGGRGRMQAETYWTIPGLGDVPVAGRYTIALPPRSVGGSRRDAEVAVARWIMYDLSLRVEGSQGSGIAGPWSGFSYEDVPSNWLGVIAAFQDGPMRNIPSLRGRVDYVLRACGAVSRAQGERMLDLQGVLNGGFHGWFGIPNYRVGAASGGDPFQSPLGQVLLFHEMLPPGLIGAGCNICPPGRGGPPAFLTGSLTNPWVGGNLRGHLDGTRFRGLADPGGAGDVVLGRVIAGTPVHHPREDWPVFRTYPGPPRR